jgi:hypothetical protein
MTDRPLVLRYEKTIRHCRILFTYSMASPTDVRVITQVELIARKSEIFNLPPIVFGIDTRLA